jgi:hypothetical protein
MGRAFRDERSALVLNSPVTNLFSASRQRRTRRGNKKDFAMVAPTKTRRLVCTVVRVAQRPQDVAPQFVRKPSALVPWADPYIAGLVRRLQSEVRMERAAVAESAARDDQPTGLDMFDNRGAALWLNQSMVADLDPPSPGADGDWDWSDEPRWSVDGEPAE